MTDPVLDVNNLRVAFRSHSGSVTALRDVSFTLHAGKTLALVGESGSGKSVTSLAIIGLLPPNGSVTGGSIKYQRRDGMSAGTDLCLRERDAQDARCRDRDDLSGAHVVA